MHYSHTQIAKKQARSMTLGHVSYLRDFHVRSQTFGKTNSWENPCLYRPTSKHSLPPLSSATVYFSVYDITSPYFSDLLSFTDYLVFLLFPYFLLLPFTFSSKLFNFFVDFLKFNIL